MAIPLSLAQRAFNTTGPMKSFIGISAFQTGNGRSKAANLASTEKPQ
jgi:hypothetical protein